VRDLYDLKRNWHNVPPPRTTIKKRKKIRKLKMMEEIVSTIILTDKLEYF
jgi:hypothetical protein